MTSTRTCRFNAALSRLPPGLKTMLPLLAGGGMLLLAGCAGGTGAAPLAQNAPAAGSVPPKNEVRAVSAALGNRLDQMLAQQVALSTH